MSKEYEIHQDDMMVAGASGENALSDALHYCFIYGQDGPVELFEVTRVKVDLDGNPALAASGGNAASELTDERAAFEADTLDLYPVATFNRFPNSDRYNVSWVQDQWGGWQRRAKYAAASAPNAALVAALKDAVSALDDVECDRFNVDMDAVSMAASAGRSALSAAGQEVGHG